MDKLDVIRKCEKLGGEDRKDTLCDVLIAARKLGLRHEIGGGRAGGINLRYGSLGLAVMDLRTNGKVKLYVRPRVGREAPENYRSRLNEFIGDNDHLDPKTHPINTYGHLEDKMEDIPTKALIGYIEEAVQCIEEKIYEPNRPLF